MVIKFVHVLHGYWSTPHQQLHRKHITLCPYTCRFFIYNYGEQCRLFSNLCAVSVYAISVEWSVCTSNPTHKKLISASLFWKNCKQTIYYNSYIYIKVQKLLYKMYIEIFKLSKNCSCRAFILKIINYIRVLPNGAPYIDRWNNQP
jgi:hypothetical protein